MSTEFVDIFALVVRVDDAGYVGNMDVFSYPKLTEAFKKFLKSEFSEENFLFLHALHELRGEKDLERWTKLYKDFIDLKANREINISNDNRTQVKKALDEVLNTTNEDNMKSLVEAFNNTVQIIHRLVKEDSWRRFVNTEQYKTEMINVMPDLKAKAAEKQAALNPTNLALQEEARVARMHAVQEKSKELKEDFAALTKATVLEEPVGEELDLSMERELAENAVLAATLKIQEVEKEAEDSPDDEDLKGKMLMAQTELKKAKTKFERIENIMANEAARMAKELPKSQPFLPGKSKSSTKLVDKHKPVEHTPLKPLGDKRPGG